MLAPLLETKAGDSSFEYKYVKACLPLRANTPFNTFLDVIGILKLGGQDLANMGVVIDDGYLYMFNDQRRMDMLDSFVAELYAGMMDDSGPNFGLPEFAEIRGEYTRNAHQIDSINNVVQRGDSIINANLQKFDATRDSLNAVIAGATRTLNH